MGEYRKLLLRAQKSPDMDRLKMHLVNFGFDGTYIYVDCEIEIYFRLDVYT